MLILPPAVVIEPEPVAILPPTTATVTAFPTLIVVPSSVIVELPIVVALVNLATVLFVPETATDVPEEPLEPDVPELPLVPEEPLEPDVPELPLVPLEPDVPDEPEVPDEPLVPLEPEVPEEPDEPLEPDVPELPDVPLLPEEPEEPSVPAIAISKKNWSLLLALPPTSITETVNPSHPVCELKSYIFKYLYTVESPTLTNFKTVLIKASEAIKFHNEPILAPGENVISSIAIVWLDVLLQV